MVGDGCRPFLKESMRLVVQRSKKSKVLVGEKNVGEIQRGMVCLVCFEKGDAALLIHKATAKLAALRIFPDSTGKMSKNITQIGGEFLCVSQFTLSWAGTKGNRPDFISSMPAALAKEYFESFCQKLSNFAPVKQGVFGEDMRVCIENDGPVTFFLQF